MQTIEVFVKNQFSETNEALFELLNANVVALNKRKYRLQFFLLQKKDLVSLSSELRKKVPLLKFASGEIVSSIPEIQKKIRAILQPAPRKKRESSENKYGLVVDDDQDALEEDKRLFRHMR